MRAPTVLIALALVAAGAVGWLLLSAPPTSTAPGPRRPEVASAPSPAAAAEAPAAAPLERVEPAPAVEAAGTRAAAPAGAPDLARVPTTAQALTGRVLLPLSAELRFTDVVGRARDSDGPAGPPAVAGPDGRLVVELERPLRGGYLELVHPRLVPTRLGPFDVGSGERRNFGLARLEAGQARAVRVRTPDGLPAEAARVWVLPAPGAAAGPLQPVTTDREGRATVVVPVRSAGLFVRHRDACARLATLPPRGETEVRIDLTDEGPALAGTVTARDDGGPLADARVELLFGNSLLFGERTDAEGRFDLGRGYDPSFALRLSAPDHETRRVDGPARPGLELERALFPLAPSTDTAFAEALAREGADAPTAVRVRAVDPDGEPLSGARFELHARPVADGLRWTPSPANPPRAAFDAGDDGWAEFSIPAAWVDDVVARAPGRVPSIVRDLARRGAGGVEVALAPGIDLSGSVRVLDGRPVPGAPVELELDGVGLRVVTDGEGWFRFAGLPTRRVRLAARAPLGFEHLGASGRIELELDGGTPPPVELTLDPDR